jgi:hypothetical protein
VEGAEAVVAQPEAEAAAEEEEDAVVNGRFNV